MTNKQAAIEIIEKLKSKGYQALLAGGCVRDMILCREANDYDVATNAKPQEVTKIFRRTVEVGAKFGVVIVLIKDQQVEVATFRVEADYVDGRHPETVHFTGAPEDAARRDFTINGMFYDPVEGKIIDYVGGQDDLTKKIIKTIGEPKERFSEDYLRMLRAVRFSTQLEFEIQHLTWQAICDQAKNITKISGERIALELEGIFCDKRRAAGAEMLKKSGLLKFVFPGLSDKNVESGIRVLENFEKEVDFATGLAALFAELKSKDALEKCEVLKLSNIQLKKIQFLLDNRGSLLDAEMSLAQLKLIAGEEYFEDLFELQIAIQKSKGLSTDPLLAIRNRLQALGDVELRPKPLLDGHDLMNLGVQEGPMLGWAIKEMYIAQLNEEIETPGQAKDWVKQWLANQ